MGAGGAEGEAFTGEAMDGRYEGTPKRPRMEWIGVGQTERCKRGRGGNG